MSLGLADFLMGIVGKLIARHSDPATSALAAVVFERLRQGGAALPANHDVENACRAALQQALAMLAEALDLSVYRPKTLVEAFSNRNDENGQWKPMLKWWHTDEGEWFEEFVREIQSEDALHDFRLQPLANTPSMNQPIRSLLDSELETLFNRALVDWIDRRVQQGERPAILDEYLHDGWPVNQQSAGVRITFYKAWCLFLQDHLKKDDKVFRILTSDWLASIDSRLAQLPLTGEQVITELQETLGEHRELLVGLTGTVREIVADIGDIRITQGELLLLATEFRAEVGKDFSNWQKLLLDVRNRLAEIGTNISTSDRKLDELRQCDPTIISKLNQLLVRDRERGAIESPASVTGQVTRRIAHSRLLESEGASRFEKLIGRSREKRMLTRAWYDDETAIVSFVAWGGVGKTSLVIDWIDDLRSRDWQGVDAFFDWTFYSQGTKDQSAASGDAFLAAALRHFGDAVTADSSQSAEDKARRLAELVQHQRTLLVLDGLEPLQHSRKPGLTEGRLKDPGIHRLLQILAQSPRPGLCVLTTREPVVDLIRFRDSSVREHSLTHLPVQESAELLHLAGARYAGHREIANDDEELLVAAKEARGHALTLQLLGGYLRTFGGDIRQRDRIDFSKAFEGQLEGHVYNVIAAYEEWFRAEGLRGQRQLSVLRMMGLFDRTANAGCVQALRRPPVIQGLTDVLGQLDDADWRETLTRLTDHRLVYADCETGDLDAHPLIREYFAQQLREQYADSWQAAHRRLYEHLCDTTKEGDKPTLAQLEPLYQAVWHGSQAGQHQHALNNVYVPRILKGTGPDGFYPLKQLGAFSADLRAVASFYDDCWSRVSPNLKAADQAWLLGQAAFHLRALGRLKEATDPLVATLQAQVAARQWPHAAALAGNLSELQLLQGNIPTAVDQARWAVQYAETGGSLFDRLISLTTLGDALHQFGSQEEAHSHFLAAERIQQTLQPTYPLLYSVQGFQYCDLLLGPFELQAWTAFSLALGRIPPISSRPPSHLPSAAHLADIESRALAILQWSNASNASLLDIGLAHLSLARAHLYKHIIDSVSLSCSADPSAHIAQALCYLRQAGTTHHLARALLTSAWYHALNHDRQGVDATLDEAELIADQSYQALTLADIYLFKAIVFDDQPSQVHATTLIRRHCYLRRLPLTLIYSSASSIDHAARDDVAANAHFLDSLIDDAKRINDVERATHLFLARARVRRDMRSYELARWDYKKHLALLAPGALMKHRAEVLLELIDIECRSGLFPDALMHIHTALNICDVAGLHDRASVLRALEDQLRFRLDTIAL